MLKLKDETLLRADAYVNGAWVGAQSGARFAVKNPANGELLAQVADLHEMDTRAAIEAASAAFPAHREQNRSPALKAGCQWPRPRSNAATFWPTFWPASVPC